MQDFETAELLSGDRTVVARVRVSLWKKNVNGFADWGGGMEPLDEILTLAPGLYTLRLSDGKEAQIIINNVRITSSVGGGAFSAATFIGNSEVPF